MRGPDEKQGEVFSYVPLEDRIPRDHPLRRIRPMVDRGLQEMWSHFEALYARRGRPSIAPERLLRALLLQALYSIRSETQLMQQLDYNVLYRWFVGLNADDPVWDVTVFTKNRERLMAGDVSQRLLEAVLRQAGEHDLLSEEHFTVDGTLIQAWASRNSFVPKEKPPQKGSGSKGKKLLRDTHESKSDPEARLYKKSAAGQPQRTGNGGPGHAKQYVGGARSSAGDAGPAGPKSGPGERANPADHAGSRQAVSGKRIHHRITGAQGDSACGRVRSESPLAELAERAGAARSGLCDQPTETEADRESVWLG